MGRIMLFSGLIILGIHFFWWLPQKWKACGTIYDNVPAQILCFSKGGD